VGDEQIGEKIMKFTDENGKVKSIALLLTLIKALQLLDEVSGIATDSVEYSDWPELQKAVEEAELFANEAHRAIDDM